MYLWRVTNQKWNLADHQRESTFESAGEIIGSAPISNLHSTVLDAIRGAVSNASILNLVEARPTVPENMTGPAKMKLLGVKYEHLGSMDMKVFLCNAYLQYVLWVRCMAEDQLPSIPFFPTTGMSPVMKWARELSIESSFSLNSCVTRELYKPIASKWEQLDTPTKKAPTWLLNDTHY